MPNHVRNKLEIECSLTKTEEIINDLLEIDGDGVFFDFNKLIPTPLHIYQCACCKKDEEDFTTWYSWNRENWGTKWNSFSGELENTDNGLIIKFDTAWSPPFPVIVAFANKYKLKFIHKYFDEGWNFWGIDIWDCCERKESKKKEGDGKELYREMYGHDYEDLE